MSRVTVDTSAYEKSVQDDAADALDRFRHKPSPESRDVARRLRDILGPRAPVPGDSNWVKDAEQALHDLYESLAESISEADTDRKSKIVRLILDLDDVGVSPEMREQEYARSVEAQVRQAREVAGKVRHHVEQAVGRVPRWAGSPVRVEVYGDNARSFKVEVGKGSSWATPSFSLFTDDDGKVEHVDDVLEGGDADFFDDPTEQFDYFNLVKELQRPGSSGHGRDLVLWTARPVKDRARYERATSVPVNIFLTTDPDRAYGLAQEGELGGGVRDVWRVVVDESDVVMTLQSGRTRDYQVVGDRPVPVKEMTLTYPAPDAGRVAARWVIRT